jgi:hypothetical protein
MSARKGPSFAIDKRTVGAFQVLNVYLFSDVSKIKWSGPELIAPLPPKPPHVARSAPFNQNIHSVPLFLYLSSFFCTLAVQQETILELKAVVQAV